MTTFYARMAAKSAELLTKYGQTVTLTRVVAGAYDPEAGAATNTETNYTGTGAVFDYNKRDIDGSVIQAADQRLLLSPVRTSGAAMPTPVPGDKVTVASVVYRVMNSRPIQPAGTIVLHEVQLRA